MQSCKKKSTASGLITVGPTNRALDRNRAYLQGSKREKEDDNNREHCRERATK
jgi:hypothetical protein